ncbi:MAG: hypothetical protein QGG53_39400 [Planctomycetota bacterium]|nr:hypothetical protein [Planctomycetota bacterium]
MLSPVGFMLCANFWWSGIGYAEKADPADTCEFGVVEEAKKFGWAPLPGAVLRLATPGKIGRSALKVESGPKPQLYMGAGLTHNIDLAGAGSEDRIILYVKQNFGESICINIRTKNGNVYRYARLKPEQWTRVELDLDISSWTQSKKPNAKDWSNADYLHIYSRGFDKAGETLLLDGFAVFVKGKPVITRK